jgi:hypothetical protein
VLFASNSRPELPFDNIKEEIDNTYEHCFPLPVLYKVIKKLRQILGTWVAGSGVG